MICNCIRITEHLAKQLVSYCDDAFPIEACGLLVGSPLPDDSCWEVRQIIPFKNIAPDPEINFEMEQHTLLSFLFNKPQEADTIMGIYHSHPSGNSTPSKQDLSTNWYTLPCHIIVTPFVQSLTSTTSDDDLTVPITRRMLTSSIHAYRYVRSTISQPVTPTTIMTSYFSKKIVQAPKLEPERLVVVVT